MPGLKVEIGGLLADLLSGVAARNRMEKVDVLRRAITLYILVDQQVSGIMPEGSRQLAIVDQDDKILVKIALP